MISCERISDIYIQFHLSIRLFTYSSSFLIIIYSLKLLALQFSVAVKSQSNLQGYQTIKSFRHLCTCFMLL